MRWLGTVTLALGATLPFACHLISGVGELEFSDSSSATGGAGGTTSSSTSDSTSSSSSSTGAGGTGGAGGAAGSGGSSGGEPCHPPDLVDHFDGAELSNLWWSWDDTFVDVLIQNGRLVIWARTPGEWQGIHTRSAFDLHDCSVWADVAQVFSSTFPAAVGFQVTEQATWDHRLYFSVAQGELEVGTQELGTQAPIYAVTYDSQAHRFWRIREASATCYFETSADGHGWTELGNTPTPDWLGAAILVISGGAWEYSQPEESLQIESVDVVP